MKGRRQVKEGLLSLETIRHGLYLCSSQRLKYLSAFERGMVVGARQFLVCIKYDPPPKGHPANGRPVVENRSLMKEDKGG